MNKEQQKIEIGKCVCGNYGDCDLDRLQCPFADCFADDVATKVINKGYRKVGKEDIVITEDENLKNLYHTAICVRKLKTKIRKETAKEILKELYDEAEGMNNKTVELSAHYIKNTLAKAYGVEL